MGLTASHPLFPALQPPDGHNADEIEACYWAGVRPWHSAAGAGPLSRAEREAWLQVLARCLAFGARESHPRLMWFRAASLRTISRGWDAAFGRFLENTLVEGSTSFRTPPSAPSSPGRPTIGAFAMRPFRKQSDAIPLGAAHLKYLSRQNVNEGLSEGFVTETQFRVTVNVKGNIFRDYSTMRRLRRLRGVCCFQFELLPQTSLPHAFGRCLSFAFPWLRCLSFYGSLVKGSDLAEFAGLPHLTELDLGFCRQLERFDGLLHFPNLVALDLLATSIDGNALYAYVVHLQDLRTLNLAGCHELASVDFGRLLACLPKLEELSLVSVPKPTLEPYLPRRDSSLAVDLSHTKMDGEVLKGWCRAPLRFLGLEYCLALTAPDLQALRLLAATLEVLNLRENGQLKSDSLSFLPSLHHVRHLSIARCPYVDDAVMEYIQDLPVVEALDLEYTAVTDRGLRYLQGWTVLRRLCIVGVRCTVASLPLLALLAERGLHTLEVAGCTLLDSSGVIYLRELPGLTVRC